MKTVAIIQARLGSTRLPAKVLLPLPTGRIVLHEVVHRAKQIKGIDEVVVAIPDLERDDVLFAHASDVATVVRGSEIDVLGRYTQAARAMGADRVMRITADCPLLCPAVCAQVLDALDQGGEYASNAFPKRTFPHGWDCEAFTREALERANREASAAYDREHVCPWMQRHLTCAAIEHDTDYSDTRWTLDTLEDYVRICKVINATHSNLRAA